MRLIKTVAALMLAGGTAAFAGPVLDFEGVGNLVRVGDFYKADYGITFGDNAWGLVSRSAGGLGPFVNTPSPDTAMGLFTDPRGETQGTASFLVNVAGGFESSFNLSYITNETSGSIQLFDAQNALLASFNLDNIDQTGCDPQTLCKWGTQGGSFSGRAYSVLITGGNGLMYFDDLELGSTTPPGRLPEPGSMALALAGFGAAAWGVRRRKPA